MKPYSQNSEKVSCRKLCLEKVGTVNAYYVDISTK
jgi:hypothetical protein